MTLLTSINDAQAQLNLPVTTTAFLNNGEAQKQLVRLSNAAGRAIARAYAWQALLTEKSFTTTATEQQTGSGSTLPTDLGWIIDDTLYNRTTTDKVFGPLSARSWQEQKASGTALTWSQYRMRGNYFYFLPAPAAGDSVYYEYASKYWCQSSGLVAQEKWAADDDTARVDEYLLTLSVIWRWNKAKGHAYDDELNEYNVELAKAMARDGTKRKLSAATPIVRALGPGKVSEGSWPT